MHGGHVSCWFNRMLSSFDKVSLFDFWTTGDDRLRFIFKDVFFFFFINFGITRSLLILINIGNNPVVKKFIHKIEL